MLRTLSIASLLSCAPRHKSSGFYPLAEAGGLIRRLPSVNAVLYFSHRSFLTHFLLKKTPYLQIGEINSSIK